MRRRITAVLTVLALMTILLPAAPRTATAGTSADAVERAATDAAAEYRVTVRTGGTWQAGTDANVYVTLVGSEGRFGPVLMDGHGDDFERGSVGTYTFDIDHLGTLQRVCVWRDNFGANPSWYLDWVKVGRKTFSFYDWVPPAHERCRAATRGWRGSPA
jgi:hypothetical protein